MRKEFRDRIMREGIVDTRNYRYASKECCNASEQWLEIRRLPLAQLDTTAAIDGWETVEVIK